MTNGDRVPERDVSLCLQVGEHFEDFVDAYIGPPALREEIADGEPRDPAALRDDALKSLQRSVDKLGPLRSPACSVQTTSSGARGDPERRRRDAGAGRAYTGRQYTVGQPTR